MLVLIGSKAAKHWCSDFRESKDIDYFSSEQVDIEGDIFVDKRLEQWNWSSIATPDELYTIKVSHSFWEIEDSWNKHMSDIVFFQRKGTKFLRELYDILLPIWKSIHRRKPTNLKQTSNNFFRDAVKRKYVHDSIHDSIAYYDEPLFTKILKDGEEVLLDKEKFFQLSHDDKLKLVREEVYTTALERILIPNNYMGSPTAAYSWALKRTITSLFKGDWALWTVLNYDELAKPDCDYRQKHLNNKERLVLV
jgi:hypothetical protein